MKTLTKLGLCALFALAFVVPSQAADKAASPAGTWTWTTPGRNGGPDRKMTLDLKVDGAKVTGSVTAPGRGDTATPTKTEIADGKLKDGEVSFTVTREFNGNKMVQNYSGKVTADSIKGKIEFERNGEKQSRDWEAKRAAAK
jgi:hypothetical protein